MHNTFGMKNNEYQQKLIAYVNEQVAQGDARARAYAFDVQGNKNPTRNAYENKFKDLSKSLNCLFFKTK